MLTLKEIGEEMSDLDNWSVETNAITKNFTFKNFKEALDFVNSVGESAEKHQHYPDIMINNENVRLSLTTYSERSLTKKDFEVARDIDKINSFKQPTEPNKAEQSAEPTEQNNV